MVSVHLFVDAHSDNFQLFYALLTAAMQKVIRADHVTAQTTKPFLKVELSLPFVDRRW